MIYSRPEEKEVKPRSSLVDSKLPRLAPLILKSLFDNSKISPTLGRDSETLAERHGGAIGLKCHSER